MAFVSPWYLFINFFDLVSKFDHELLRHAYGDQTPDTYIKYLTSVYFAALPMLTTECGKIYFGEKRHQLLRTFLNHFLRTLDVE